MLFFTNTYMHAKTKLQNQKHIHTLLDLCTGKQLGCRAVGEIFYMVKRQHRCTKDWRTSCIAQRRRRKSESVLFNPRIQFWWA